MILYIEPKTPYKNLKKAHPEWYLSPDTKRTQHTMIKQNKLIYGPWMEDKKQEGTIHALIFYVRT